MKAEEVLIWSRVEFKLEELLKECGNDKMRQKRFIEDKCKEKSKSYDPEEKGQKDFFEIPKAWFIKDKGGEEVWETKVSVSTTRTFKHFGVLNRKKAVYLAFKNCKDVDDEYGDEFENTNKEFQKMNLNSLF